MSRLRITALRLLCPDPARTAAFYAEAFGAGTETTASGVTVALGEQRVELVRTSAPRSGLAASNATSFQHFAIVVSDMGSAFAQLDAVRGWTPISRAGPERLPPSTGGVSAFKFRDPDGHPLELLQFVEGAVPSVWGRRAGLFLGIDHTVITVADTERSVAFYVDLGFAVSSRGVNRGIEQERLDDVKNPVVEVTGLVPPGGAPPHLELLCYREPGPQPTMLEDGAVLATRTVVTDELRGSRLDEDRLLTDPDGHRLTIG